MPERDRYIPGVPCWIDTTQPDPDAAAGSTAACSAGRSRTRCPRTPPAPTSGRLHGGLVAAVGSQMESAGRRSGTPTSGSTTPTRPQPRPARPAEPCSRAVRHLRRRSDGVFADPEGAVFGVWQPNQHRGAKVVNEPGSLNFNGLDTRDLEGAKAFYGAVFGWDALPVGMWALPGYGDHLEELNPGIREQTGQMGAPDGFIDVVAALTRSPTTRPTRRRTGTSRSASTTPTRSPPRRSSAARDRAAVRRAVDPRDRDPRPPGRDVQRQPVRAREQGHRRAGRPPHGVMSARSAVSVSRSTTVSSGRPRPV